MDDEPELLAEIPLTGGYTVDVWSCGRIDLPASHFTLTEAVMLISALQKAIEVLRSKSLTKPCSKRDNCADDV